MKSRQFNIRTDNISLSPLRTRNNQLNTRRQRTKTQHNGSNASFQKRSQKYCVTHVDKLAEYCYSDEEEQVMYCCICAAKLASQGFHLVKIQGNHSRMTKNASQRNLKQNEFQLKPSQQPVNGGHSRVKCVKHAKNILIKQVDNLAINVEKLLKKYSQLSSYSLEDTEYERQKQLVDKFYQKIIEIVTEYQQKHLRKMQQQRSSNEIQLKKKIQANIHQLRTISQDMLSTDFDQVLQNVSQNDFKMCCQFYRAKYEQFSQEYGFLSSKVSEMNNSKQNKKKCNVTTIQNTIDMIEKNLNQLYDPNEKYRSKSTQVQNFLRQYEKVNKNRGKCISYYSNNPDEKGKGQTSEISQPQFKRF